MKELLNILQIAQKRAAAGEKFAIATVVKIGGSTYRRPGARMLVSSDGARWGTISGGCLEGEVAQQALEVIESGRPQLLPFDLEEDDIVLGFGTGCNGVVHVLIQPVDPSNSPSIVDALQYCIQERKTSILATVIAADGGLQDHLGAHLLISEDGSTGPSTLSDTLVEKIIDISRHYLDEELQNAQMYLWHTETFETPAGSFQALFEVVRPPIKLYIFGEGHDVMAVLNQGNLMGWEVEIVGRKPIEILSDRFPTAAGHKFLMHPDTVLDQIAPDARSAALVMNHTYVRDRDVMQQLLSSHLPYIGMLGPKERTEQMLADFEAQDQRPEPELLTRLFGPVGLDIGTETPEEIALSAVAEIQSVLHRRRGTSLRDRESPIHSSRNPIESVS